MIEIAILVVAIIGVGKLFEISKRLSDDPPANRSVTSDREEDKDGDSR